MTVLGKNNVFKRIAAFVLAVLMVFSLVPFDTSVAKAEESTDSPIEYIFNVSIKDENGDATPVKDASVSLYKADTVTIGSEIGQPINHGQTNTNENGSITISSTSYSTITEGEKYIYHIYYDGYIAARGFVSESTTKDIILEKAVEEYGIQSHVYAADGNTPVSGALVYLIDSNNNIVDTQLSDGAGIVLFRYGTLSAGTYTLKAASADAVGTVTKELTNTGISDTPNIVLQAKTTAPISFEKEVLYLDYDETATITGTNVIKGEPVSWIGEHSYSYQSSANNVATVDANGQVTVVGTGNATITATLNCDEFLTTTITYNLKVINGAVIKGKVTDDRGNNGVVGKGKAYLVDSDVTIDSFDENTVIRVSDIIEGVYTFDAVEAGEYNIIIQADGYASKLEAISVTEENVSGNTPVEKNIVNVKKIVFDISGTVTGAEDDVLSNMKVVLYKGKYENVSDIPTECEKYEAILSKVDESSNYTYTFKDMPIGFYTAVVLNENYKTVINNIEVIDNNVISDITLEEKIPVTLNFAQDESILFINGDKTIANELTIKNGEEIISTDGWNFAYTSSNSDVIQLSDNLLNNASIKDLGTTEITVTALHDEYKIDSNSDTTFTVQVFEFVFESTEFEDEYASAKENNTTITRTYNDELSSKAVVKNADGEIVDIFVVAYHSTEETVAKIDNNGAIKIVGKPSDDTTKTMISAVIADGTNFKGISHFYELEVVRKTHDGLSWNHTFTEQDANGNEKVTYKYSDRYDETIKQFTVNELPTEMEVSYASSDDTKVAVDENGVLTIKDVTGEDGVTITATATSSVYEIPTPIHYTVVVTEGEHDKFSWDVAFTDVENKTLDVYYEDSLMLNTTGQYEDAEVVYSVESTNNAVSYDKETGFSVNNVGTATITAKIEASTDGKFAEKTLTCTVNVLRKKQDDLSWNINGDSIGAEKTYTYGNDASFIISIENQNPSEELIHTFSTSEDGTDIAEKDKVVLIGEDGKVTIQNSGEVTIYYTSTDGNKNYEEKVLSFILKVNKGAQPLVWDKENLEDGGNIDVTFNDPSFEIRVKTKEDCGDTSKLTGTFSSDDPNVATVDPSSGKVAIVGVGDGQATITYTSTDSNGNYENKTLSYIICVNKDTQDGFKWSNGIADKDSEVDVTYNKNNKEYINAAAMPAENAQIAYNSSDESIATVDSTGKVTIIKAGKVTISASIEATANYKSKTLSYVLDIDKATQVISFDKTEYTFVNGGKFSSPKASSDESEASGAYTYTVESDVNGVIASINKNTGELSFTLQPGEVTIKVVRAADDRYKAAEATYTLTVKAWNPLSSGNIGTYYSITGTKEDVTSPWYTKADVNHPIRLVAANGYQLYKGTTDPTPSTTWSSYIDISDIHEGKANGIVYYIREISTGYVSKQYAINNIHVDTTAPGAAIIVDDATIWEKVLSFFTFDIFGQNTPELAISSSDETSGVKSVYYYVSNSLEPLESNGLVDASALEKEATWKTYSGKVDLLNENVAENVIYTKVIDNAGNVTYASTNGLIFDGAKPVVTPTIVTKDVNGLYNGNVEINLDVVDTAPYSGIQEITYVVENTGTITDKGTLFTFSPAQAGNPKKSELISSWNSADYGKNVIVKAADNNSDNVKVTFTVTDNAGNTTESIVDLKIDITAPAINVQYNNNAGDTSFVDSVYYNSDRMATITVKDRHFDANRVKLTITNTDGVIPGLSEWTKISSGTGNGDDTTYVATVYFTADGDYTFDISCADIAENTNTPVNYGDSQAPTAFTIDKIAPTISISYDNNDALNENYFKADRTATVVIHEHNFDASRVNAMITATDDGQDIAAPAISGWSSSGDTHTAYINYSSDALYTFDIDYTDKAGNVMADVAPQTFYVDKTTPQVSITEIVDLSANNAEKIGFVITATDTNFDVFTPVLTAVTQTENGFTTTEMDVASIAEITNGQVYTVDNLESDGIYSITCSAIDKAGNAYTEVNLQRADGSTYVESRAGEDTLIMFSVNRLGSTFDIDANTKDILDKYYVQNVENDLVIYEVNTNELLSYSISLNGEELTEGTDYTVSNSGGNGEWMRYTYTVNKNLFENEGEYVLVISSTDGAENNAFSDVKNTNISFVVDRTAPVVTVTGMESGRSYQTDRQTVTLMPTDDGGIIETLMVRLVDRDGNVLEEILNMSGDELREALETNGGTIKFDLSEGLNQNIQIICGDGSYNAQGQPNTFNQTFEDVSVSASALAIFFAGNTMLYIGGGAGTAAAVGGGVFFFRRRKFPKLIKKK